MSPTKRKSIVFDLDDGKKAKNTHVHQRGEARVPVQGAEEPAENWVSYMQPEILTMSFMIELLDQVINYLGL